MLGVYPGAPARAGHRRRVRRDGARRRRAADRLRPAGRRWRRHHRGPRRAHRRDATRRWPGRVDHPAGAAPGSSDATAEHGTAIASLASGGAGPAGLHGVAPAARILAIRVLDAGRRRRARRHDRRPSGRPRAGRRPRRQRRPGGSRPRRRRRGRGALRRRSTTRPRPARSPALDTLGTVVVAPAGNDGPTGARYGSLSSPGGAADALTVGASDGRPALPQVDARVRRRGRRARRAAALAGALAPPAGQALPVKTITGAARTTHTPARWPPTTRVPTARPLVAGAAVLVPRDGGDLRAKVRQAAAQGAAEVLLYGAVRPARRRPRRRRRRSASRRSRSTARSACASPRRSPPARRSPSPPAPRPTRRTPGATPSRRSRPRASAGTTA